MGPQEHAFRSGVDVIVGTPGRLLDHFRAPYAKLAGLEFLVLDEADRMLDMGFLPDIRRVLRHLPTKRQTLFFSATMPPPIAAADARDAARSGDDQPRAARRRRRSGITQAVYPVPQHLKAALLLKLLKSGEMQRRAGLHAHQAPRRPAGASHLGEHGHQGRADPRQPLAGAAHRGAGGLQERQATGCWSPPTSRRAASTSPRSATSSTSTCRCVPDDYIHRVGRTARAETDRRRVHAGVAGGRGQHPRHRARDRQAAAARHGAGLRLRRRARRRRRSTSGRRGRRGSSVATAAGPAHGAGGPRAGGGAGAAARAARGGAAARSSAACLRPARSGAPPSIVHDESCLSGGPDRRTEGAGAFRAPRRGGAAPRARGDRAVRPTPTRSRRSSTRRSGPASAAKRSTSRRSRWRSCRRRRRRTR